MRKRGSSLQVKHPILWYIGKHTVDTDLYNLYEYKCKELGLTDNITDADQLIQTWQQEWDNEELEYNSEEVN